MALRRAERERPAADRVCLTPDCGCVVPAHTMRLLCPRHDELRAQRLAELMAAGLLADIGDRLRDEFGC